MEPFPVPHTTFRWAPSWVSSWVRNWVPSWAPSWVPGRPQRSFALGRRSSSRPGSAQVSGWGLVAWCCVLLGGSSSGTLAAILSVNAEGTGDYPDIQSAIDAAKESDIIELEDGVYTGPGNRDLDFGNQTVRVRSRSNLAENCVIDCEFLGRAAYFPPGQTVDTELRAITVYRGNADAAPVQAGLGGGVLIVSGDPHIVDCVFRECVTTDRGGALAMINGANSDVLTTRFENNQRTLGDGARVHGLTLPHGSGTPVGGGAVYVEGSIPFFIDCQFENNGALDGAGGAALCATGAPQFLNGIFEGNRAGLQGGAVACLTSSFAVINFCVFTGNQSEQMAGAIAVSTAANPTITGCLFRENEAPRTGALYVGAGVASTIEGCTFERNLARHDGAGALELDAASATVRDCTFEDNESQAALAGAALARGGAPRFEGGRVRGNRAAQGSGGLAIVSASGALVQDMVITGNLGAPGGVLCEDSTPSFERTTVAANGSTDAGLSGGLHARGSALLVDRSIFWGNCGPGGFPSDLDVLGAGGTVLSCVALSPEGFVGATDVTVVDAVFGDPRFCDAGSCGSAPSTSGDVSLAAGSPCLAPASPCGATIGALGEGCDTPNPTRHTSWGSLKHRFVE